MNIQPTYVTFEQAKRLKEKRFIEGAKCQKYWYTAHLENRTNL